MSHPHELLPLLPSFSWPLPYRRVATQKLNKCLALADSHEPLPRPVDFRAFRPEQWPTLCKKCQILLRIHEIRFLEGKSMPSPIVPFYCPTTQEVSLCSLSRSLVARTYNTRGTVSAVPSPKSGVYQSDTFLTRHSFQTGFVPTPVSS